MSVKIRLKRFGTIKRAQWRMVVADARMPRDGRFIEEVGYYDPGSNPAYIKVDGDRVRYWLSKGAQPTETVRSLLKKHGFSKAG